MPTRDLALIALFAALTAVLGVFPLLMIPALGIPITVQSMAPMLAGGVLGAKRGALSLLLFTVLVAVGLPLLSGGRGGLAPLIGPWSGFIYGWIVSAFAVGWLTERFWTRLNAPIAFVVCLVGGIGVTYAIGVPWFAALSGTSVATAFTGSMVALLPGDLVKAAVAAAVIVSVRRAYPLIEARIPAASAR